MEAFILQISISGATQTHPRVFTSYATADKQAKKLLNSGAVEAANIITVGVHPIRPVSRPPTPHSLTA